MFSGLEFASSRRGVMSLVITLRQIETYELVGDYGSDDLHTNCIQSCTGVEEICTKLRPPPVEPLAGNTVASHGLILLAER